jgi:hypothetical protein
VSTQKTPTGSTRRRRTPASIRRLASGASLALLVIPLASVGGGQTAQAADGSVLRTVTAEGYNCSLGTGIAFDGQNLLLSCSNDNKITAVDPTDGSLVKSYSVSGVSSIGALAYDRGREVLWACGGFSGDDTVVWQIDLETSLATQQFDGPVGCPDGLAYDGRDDTFWLSPDVSPTVYHYSMTGELLGSVPANLGSCGNSGIAVGGDYLFFANNGCSQIYMAPRTDPTSTTLFGTYGARLEDLECDDVSFADLGKAAIWSKDAYDGVLNAFELNPGTCGFGGLPPVANIDSDGDGLSDAWETSGARDSQGKVTFDLASMGARPDRKDIFLAVEAERSAPLSSEARAILIDSFARAPVSNPDGYPGIALHFVDGPTLSNADSDTFYGSSPARIDWREIWNHWTDREPQGPSVFHLVLSTAWNDFRMDDGAKISGIATLPGQMLVVNNCGKRSKTRTTCATDATSQAANLMHELGHNLWLGHGGGDGINKKPNYLSVMNYHFSHTGVPGLGVTYSNWGDDTFYMLDENSLSEPDGVLVKSGENFLATKYMCSSWNIPRTKTIAVGQPVDWNCQNKVEQGRVKADINGDGKFNQLTPYDDWSNLSIVSNEDNIGWPKVEYRVGETEYCVS